MYLNNPNTQTGLVFDKSLGMTPGQKTILIADDDKAVVDSIAAILELSGYDVLKVNDGTSVMDAVKALPNLILLDIQMPGHDGTSVCRQLKRQGTTKNIPIMILSASINVGQQANDAGADDYLEKPFDMHVLQSKIATLLGE
jgi:CheY-like chemotaxis protein